VLAYYHLKNKEDYQITITGKHTKQHK